MFVKRIIRTKEEDKHIWALCNWQQAVRCRFVPVLICNFLPEFCSNRLEIRLNKFISQTITQIRQSHKKSDVCQIHFTISTFPFEAPSFSHRDGNDAVCDYDILLHKLGTLARWHVANHLKLICIRLLARNFCSRNADTLREPNPVFRHGPITHCSGGQTAACHCLTLSRWSIARPWLPPVLKYFMSSWIQPDSVPSLHLFYFTLDVPPFASLIFFSPVICDSPLQGAEASLLSVPTEVSSIIILKAF